MTRRLVLPCVVLAVALAATAAAACGDGDVGDARGTPEPGDLLGVAGSPVPAGSPLPAESPVPTPTRIAVGNGAADLVLNAGLAADAIELARLTGYIRLPCEPDAETAGPGLQCRPEEQPGDGVDVLYVTRCQSGWVRPEDVAGIYEATMTGSPRLVALYRPQARRASAELLLSVEYVAVFRTDDRPDGTHFGVALHVTEGRIVHIEEPCIGVLQLLAGNRVAEWVLAPGELPLIVP